MKLWVGDYLRTNVSGCSLAAQGLYFRLKLIAHETERRGFLQMNGKAIPDDMICRKTGCPESDFQKLLKEITDSGDIKRQTGILYDVDLVQKEASSKIKATAGSKGGSKTQALAAIRSDYETEYDNDVDSVPEVLRTSDFRSSWIEWLMHRIELGKKVTAGSRRQQLTKLADMGTERAVAALKHSTAQGWQGIFENNTGGNNVKHRGRITTEADHSKGF